MVIIVTFSYNNLYYKLVYFCRCKIPVVIMGETGCGKTHLIRYMCKFAAYKKYTDSGDPIQNMFVLKVI